MVHCLVSIFSSLIMGGAPSRMGRSVAPAARSDTRGRLGGLPVPVRARESARVFLGLVLAAAHALGWGLARPNDGPSAPHGSCFVSDRGPPDTARWPDTCGRSPSRALLRGCGVLRPPKPVSLVV